MTIIQTLPAGSTVTLQTAQTTRLTPSGDTTGAADQAAVSAAITALLEGGAGKLVLGAGDWYWTSQQIDIYLDGDYKFLSIVGEGEATRIHSVATGGGSLANALFYVYGGGDNVIDIPYPGPIALNWIELADMTLIGNSTCGPGIALQACFQGRIGNVTARDFLSTATAAGAGEGGTVYYGAGIWVAWSQSITIEATPLRNNTCNLYLNGNDCMVREATSTGDAEGGLVGIMLDNGLLNVITDSGFLDGDIVISSGGGNVIERCWLEGGTAIRVNNTYGTEIRRLMSSGTINHVFIGATCADTSIVHPAKMGVVVVNGAKNTSIVDPPWDFTYAANVQDGTAGAELGIRRSVPITNTQTASTGALTLPSAYDAQINRVTLAASPTLTFPTPVKGHKFELWLTQDATGSRIVTWPTTVVWPAGSAPTLTTTAAKQDGFEFVSDGVNWIGRSLAANVATVSTLTPALTDLAGWWDVSQAVAQDNTVLFSLPDLSGHSRHLLAQASANPWSNRYPLYYSTTRTLKGLPVAFFGGDDQLTYWGQIAAAAISQPYTIYVVCRPTAVTSFTAPVGGIPKVYITGGKWALNAGADLVSGSTNAVVDTAYLLAVVCDGASSKIRVNGVEVASGDAGADAFPQLMLGAYAAGSGGFKGDIAEALLYSSAHTTQLATIEGYLTTKWI